MNTRTILLSLFLLLPAFVLKAQERDGYIIDQVTEKPSFDGGSASDFSKWVQAHKRYPEEAKKAGIKGRVVTCFTITKEGKLTDVRILRGVHPLLDEEAVRVIESAPQKWKAGKDYKGEPTETTFTFSSTGKVPKTCSS